MKYTVVNTRRAERDLLAAAHWWAENRSPAQADRWLEAIHKKIESLAKSPLRCPLAPEHERFSTELRELHFGVRRRPTHRIIFTVAEDVVLVLAVRHVAQDELQADDLV